MSPICGARFDAEVEEMPPQKDRRRGAMLDAEATGAFEEPVHRLAVERAGRRPRQSDFASRAKELEVHFLRETTERSVADFVTRLEPHAGLQVLRRHTEHLAAHVVALNRIHVQSIEKGGCGRHALLLVIDGADAAVEEGGGRRLAQVVTDGTEHDRKLLGAGRSSIRVRASSTTCSV
jgi:hypothetical protein